MPSSEERVSAVAEERLAASMRLKSCRFAGKKRVSKPAIAATPALARTWPVRRVD